MTQNETKLTMAEVEEAYKREQIRKLSPFDEAVLQALLASQTALREWLTQVDEEGDCTCCGCNHQEVTTLARAALLAQGGGSATKDTDE